VFARILLLFLACFFTAAMASDKPSLEGLLRAPMPRFPPELVGVKAGDGEAVMVITIGTGGLVEDSVALEATHEAFAREATDAIKDWQFASGAGTTWPRREVLQFSFKRSGVVTTLSHAEGAREHFIGTPVPRLRTVPLGELDREPMRTASTMPQVSKAALAKRGKEPLMVNFVIDREGRVRVPVVTVADDPEFAQAVLAAVRQWRYTPPLQNGEPVAVEMTRSLVLPGAETR
jgi:TonB family protein